jgi:hypothetical protein
MHDLKSWHLAWARFSFSALTAHPPRSWDASAVGQYHEIVSALEEASSGDDLSLFRIPQSEMKPRLLSVQRIARSGIPGRVNYSKVLYCDEQYARRQMEGIAAYFQSRSSLRNGTIK